MLMTLFKLEKIKFTKLKNNMIYIFITLISVAFIYAVINVGKSIKSFDPVNPSLRTDTTLLSVLKELEGSAEVTTTFEYPKSKSFEDTLVQDLEKTEQAIETKVEQAVDTVEETVKHEVEVVKAATHKKRKPKSNPTDEDHIN